MLTTTLKRAAGPRLARNLGLIALAASFPSASLAPVCAQAGKEVPAGPSQTAAPTSPAPAATVLAQIGRAAGVTIVADSVVGAQRVQAPREATTSANFEQQVAGIVRQLPPGTDWAKLMLPAPAPGHSWKGDDVALFAVAAFRLYGVGVFSRGSVHPAAPAAAISPGMSLLAQPIPAAKAAQYTADLHLQPVYIVASSNARPAPNSDMGPLAAQNDIASAASRGTFAPVVGPQDTEKALSRLPPAERDQILEELQRDPDSVHIESDGNGLVRVTIHKMSDSEGQDLILNVK